MLQKIPQSIITRVQVQFEPGAHIVQKLSYKHSIDAEDLIYKLQLTWRLQIIITNYKLNYMPLLHHKIGYAKY